MTEIIAALRQGSAWSVRQAHWNLTRNTPVEAWARATLLIVGVTCPVLMASLVPAAGVSHDSPIRWPQTVAPRRFWTGRRGW